MVNSYSKVVRAMDKLTSQDALKKYHVIINEIIDNFNNYAKKSDIPESISYIDEDTDIDTLVTPGLYVTRNGRFTNAPIKMIRNDGSVSENTYQYVPVLDVDEFGDILNVYTDTVTGKIRQVFYSTVLPSPVFRIIGSNALDRYWAFNNNAYACTDNGTMGNVFADGTTIKADKFGSLSVVPEGLVDNDTIFVEDGKIKSKSVPFDGGSIFACLAGNKEGVFINEGDGVNKPNLSDSSFQKSQDGKSFCHIEDNAIVLDEEGFYILRLRRAFYPDVSNTNEMDLTQSISYKPVGSSAFSVIGTQTLRMNNDPDLWQYCDFSIVLHGKVGDAISTVSYEPVVAGVTVYSGAFGLYVFKIPTTAASVQNGSAYRTITLTADDNIDNLTPGSYYKPSGVTPQGTLPTFSSVDQDYVIMVYGTSNSEINESFKQTIFSADNFYRILIREFLNGAYTQWFNILGNSTTTNNGIAYLATDEQIVAGVETGARIVTPAGAKLAIRTFAAPMPTASEGLGNWYLVAVNDSKFTLKSGGTWAYFALGYANGGAVISTTAGIAAGGQTIQLITTSEAPIVSATGFAWQIQNT